MFIIFPIQLPHSSLFINMCFFHLFSKFLLFYLSSKFFSHSLLIRFHFVIEKLIIQSVLNLFLFFKTSYFHFFFSGFGVHLLQNSIGHSSHELLGSLLSSLKLLSSVFFLLKEHSSIRILCSDVFQSLSLLFF